MLGNIAFLINAMLVGLMVLGLAQDKWYAPNPCDASWQNGLRNVIGAMGLFPKGPLGAGSRAGCGILFSSPSLKP